MTDDDEARRRYVQGELNKAQPFGGYLTKLKLRTPNGETKWLSVDATQQRAIEAVLTAEPEVEREVEFSGKVILDGTTSHFMMLNDGDWTQWGVDQQAAGRRVDLLDKVAEAYREWQDENLCRTCKERLLDDGEGYNGECGDCADRNYNEEGDDDD